MPYWLSTVLIGGLFQVMLTLGLIQSGVEGAGALGVAGYLLVMAIRYERE